MKRIAASVVLLGGLSGCISITPPAPGDKAGEVKSTANPAARPGTTASASGSAPVVVGGYTVDPGHIQNGSYMGSATRSDSAYPRADALPPRPTPVNLSPAPTATASPYGAAPGASLVAQNSTPGMPGSLVPPVVTPTAPALTPAMKDVPVVLTPSTPASSADSIRQTSFTTPAEPHTPTPASTKLDVVGLPSKPPVQASAAPTPTKPAPAAEMRTVKGGPPLMRLVNTKRITLNFEVKDVGPWGLAGVELWYTQNCREWKKYDAPVKAKAYVVEVDEEGMYGFALRAKSGIGLGQEPPAPGDQPEVWVMVDLTRPDVQLTEVTPTVNTKPQQVVIRWKAMDKNMSRQPITLYYAAREEGPWKVIAANLENTGRYVWQTPSDAPPKFLVRAEASDLAGNVGRAQTATPVLLDTRVPSVSIINVEANPSR